MPRLSAARRSAPPEASPPTPGSLSSHRTAVAAAGLPAAFARLPQSLTDGSRFVAAICLVSLSLLAVPTVAQAQTVTLVSNTGQTATSAINRSGQTAQRFTTGTNASGYTLSTIEIPYSDAQNDAFSVAVYSVDADNLPETVKHSFTAPGSFAAGTLVFTAPSNATLDANTTYAVVIGGTGNALSRTASVAEDAGKAAGWSIADAYDWRNSTGSTWNTPSTTNPLLIAIKGTIKGTTTNTPATGEPAITGVAQDDKMLTADATGIMDDDGVPSTLTYQWVQVDPDGSSNETDITGATDITHTLTSSDVGKKIRVKVSFNDDGGTDETRTSDAYPSYANVMAAKGTCPTDTDWCATLESGYDSATTAISISHYFGYVPGSSFGGLSPVEFTHGGTTYTVTQVYRTQNTSLDGTTVLAHSLLITVTGDMGETLPDGTVLDVGGQTFTVGTGTATTETGQEQWGLKTLGISLNWVEGGEVSISLKLPVTTNTAATGEPVITGTAQEGETLTAGKGTIADVDVEPADFPDDYTFQWVRVAGALESDITKRHGQRLRAGAGGRGQDAQGEGELHRRGRRRRNPHQPRHGDGGGGHGPGLRGDARGRHRSLEFECRVQGPFVRSAARAQPQRDRLSRFVEHPRRLHSRRHNVHRPLALQGELQHRLRPGPGPPSHGG